MNKVQIGTRVMVKGGDVHGIVIPTIHPDGLDGLGDKMVSVILLDQDTLYPGSVASSSAGQFYNHYEIVANPKTSKAVVIMSDMEGVTGVPNSWDAVTPAEETGGVRTLGYSVSCRSMTIDVLMAIAGARAAGARITVADSHWHDTNLSDEDFDVEVLRGSQAAIKAMANADATMLIGWHARAGAPDSCLPHTYTERIKQLKIDGVEVGEVGMLARLAAHQNTPVVLVTGDRAACSEATNDFGCRTVTSKSVDHTGAVTHRCQTDVWREIVGEAYKSVLDLPGIGSSPPLLPRHVPGQFDVSLHPQFAVKGDDEAELVGAGDYRIKGASILETYSAFLRLVERLPSL